MAESRSTLKDFLRAHPYGAKEGTDKIDYIIDQQGDGTADPGVDDLREDIRDALGDYVAKETNESNRYFLKPGSEDFSIIADDGGRAHHTVGSGGSAVSYDKNIDAAGLRSYYDTISGGSAPDAKGGGTFDGNQIADVVDKSGKDEAKTGHEALKQARDKALISPVLTQFNRFHPDGKSPYNPSRSPMSSGDVDALKFVSKQDKLGEYDSNSGGVKLKEMKDIGHKLIVAATGHSPSTGDLAAILPSLQQLGATKVDPNDVLARNVEKPGFGGGNRETKGASVTKVYKGFRDKSWGVLNSPLEPFGATPKMGMTVLVIALVLAIGILVDLVAMIIGALILPLPSSNKLVSSYNNPNPGKIGKFFRGSGAALVKPSFFGVRPTNMDFVEATSLGTEIFFGEVDAFKGGSGGIFSFLPGGRNINDSPGYYSIVFRAVIRSTIEIGLAFGDIFKGGLFAALGAIADLFATIRNSKLIGYINMLAAMGDIYEDVLIEADASKIISKPGDASGVIDTKVSSIDAIELKAGIQEYRVGKSRYTIDGADQTLVWRQGAPPSTYLISADVLTMAKSVGGEIVSFGLEDPNYQNEFKDALGDDHRYKQQVLDSGDTRLSAELVKKVEDLCEGEYMPFYFHDIRTNEIVSFNAFLTSLSDSYTANYDSNQGYGRADPVMIYNNTQRAIGMTFWVVSTNPRDFDEMWWKINKLTTLMYPQYSGGTMVQNPDVNDDKPFTAPFSQVLAASPMIRLRLGDLIKSNYSKFALARLFGPGVNPDFAAEAASDIISAVELTEDVNSAINKSATPEYAEPPLLGAISAKFTSKERVKVMIQKDGKEKMRQVWVPSGMVFEISKIEPTLESLEMGLTSGDFGNISKYGIAHCKVTAPIPPARKTVVGAAGALAAAALKYGTFQQAMKVRDLDLSKVVIPYYILAKAGVFEVDPDSIEYAPAADPPDFGEFMSSETNPVVRAFESSMGRGLAGFITQMDFQWLDQITWETSEGSKAPKACQITISFSPIHDIGPGLDKYGMNRAPIYNAGNSVGKLARGPYEKSKPNGD